MDFAYIIKDQFALYFVTFTVNQWLDVFTGKLYSISYLKALNVANAKKNRRYLLG